MAEVGLVRFAHLALEVAAAVLPRYRIRFSKRQFTQPQLLAIPLLMSYEDWTYREVEVRLREHSELRRALGLGRVPDHSTLCRFLRRLAPGTIGEALGARRAPPSLPYSPRPVSGRGCDRSEQWRPQHVLCPSDASSHASVVSLATLAEMAGGGFGPAPDAGMTVPTCPPWLEPRAATRASFWC